MKTLFRSLWLLALTMVSICVFVMPCLAQQTTPTPTIRKAKASAPELGQIPVVFSVSTSGDGSALGSTGDYLPSGVDVDPQTKDYFITLIASVTIPLDVDASFLPASVQLNARRFYYTLSSTGTQQRNYTGDTLGDLPVLNRLPNTTETQYGRTYTYSTFEQNNHENLQEHEARRVNSDWNVSKVLGRWELRVRPEDGASNAADVKINKRNQITNTAIAWAYYYQYKQSNATTQAELDKWSSTNHPDGLFGNCFAFAKYIYEQNGLDIPAGSGTAMFGSATAIDNGPGSLRFFWTKEANPQPATDPGHASIIGPFTILLFDTRIDNNGKPERLTYGLSIDGVLNPQRFNGPLLRAINEGVGDSYFGNGTALPPVNATLPGKRDSNISLLQELDME